MMNADEIRALAKERLGRDITEEEAQSYLDGSVELPDEALELASGGCPEVTKCSHEWEFIGISMNPGYSNYRCAKCGCEQEFRSRP